MKSMKKLIVAVIAVMAAMALCVPALAFGAEIIVEKGAAAADGTLSQDVLEDETYKAYKVLNYTSDTTKNPAAYSYYLTAAQYDANNQNGLGKLLEAAGMHFTASADGSVYYVDNTENLSDATSIVSSLYANKDKIAAVAIASASATATSDKQAVFSNLDTGYWFVTSSMGALCSLQSYDDQNLIVEKNSMITDEKTVSDTEAQVGDTLTYTVTLTDGEGTNLEAKIIDTMSKGLTYNNDATAKANGADLTKGEDFTVSTATGANNSTVVTYTFTPDVMTALKSGEKIVVTYTALVNADASIDGTVMNAEVTQYSEQETNGNHTETELTDMNLIKTDGTDRLKGAQFKLFRTDAEVNANHAAVMLRELTDDELDEAKVTKANETVYYTVDPNSTNDLIDMAQKDANGEYLYSAAVVYGLDEDSTYYLLETKAPEGYNKLANEKEVVLATTNTIEVENQAGVVLPSTGGMGTTILYIVGGIMIALAVVFLVRRRFISKKNESDDLM